MLDALISLCLIVAVLLATLGFWYRARVRRVARWILGTLFIAASSLTLGLVYLSIVTSRQGGGVLILVAMVTGIVAWVFGWFFFAIQDARRYYRQPLEERMAETRRLADEIERTGTPEARDLITRARDAIADPRTYQKDEPDS